LQKVIYARNKLMLIAEKILITHTQEEKHKFINDLKIASAELVRAINIK
jgi:hypothetical protein